MLNQLHYVGLRVNSAFEYRKCYLLAQEMPLSKDWKIWAVRTNLDGSGRTESLDCRLEPNHEDPIEERFLKVIEEAKEGCQKNLALYEKYVVKYANS